MLNLKKLTFYLLIVFLKCVLINPIHLIKELTMHLSQLDPFSFYLSIENNKEGLLITYPIRILSIIIKFSFTLFFFCRYLSTQTSSIKA